MGGVSNGCITFLNSSEFTMFRNALLQLKKKTLTGTSTQVYGVAVVTGYSKSDVFDIVFILIHAEVSLIFLLLIYCFVKIFFGGYLHKE